MCKKSMPFSTVLHLQQNKDVDVEGVGVGVGISVRIDTEKDDVEL